MDANIGSEEKGSPSGKESGNWLCNVSASNHMPLSRAEADAALDATSCRCERTGLVFSGERSEADTKEDTGGDVRAEFDRARGNATGTGTG